MKNLTLFFSLLLFPTIVNAQTEWENTFGLPDSSFALDMIQVQDGDFVLYGGTNAFTENSQAFLLKFNSFGNLVWLRDLGFHAYPYEGTLIEANNGDLIVCGEKIMRCNDLGNEIWTLNQASVDIDEADNGDLFSVNYDKVFKFSSEGNIILNQEIASSFEEFNDLILNGFVYNTIQDSLHVFNQIECIGNSLTILSGVRLSELENGLENHRLISLIVDQNDLEETDSFIFG